MKADGPLLAPNSIINSITGGKTKANDVEQNAPISEMKRPNIGTSSARANVSTTKLARKARFDNVGCLNGPICSFNPDHIISAAIKSWSGYVSRIPIDTTIFTDCANLKSHQSYNNVAEIMLNICL